MPDIKEDILQFIWQHKLLNPVPLISISGKEIQVIAPGELNKDAGPDFFNARIKVNDLVLAGNVEVHVKSSDWLKHKHQQDNSYNNLVLHVVYENNKEIKQNTEHNVEVLEIKRLVPDGLLNNYHSLISSKSGIPCASQLPATDNFRLISWLERMQVERLEYKVRRFENFLEFYNGNYSHVFYTLLMRNFGFKVNAGPFELLAKHLPLNILLKHTDTLHHLEALLLGTAGFLDEQYNDRYLCDLQNEFEYLKRKYSLLPLAKELFKFSRLRPANFPTLRLAQVAKLIHQQPSLFSAPHTFDSFEKLLQCLSVEPENYWQHHYSPGGNITGKNLKLGKDSIQNLIINTFAPFFFFYFKKTGISGYEQVSLKLLQQCGFENNVKTRQYKAKKEILRSAGDSQALIHLHDNFCKRKKCLQCGIAASILQSR